MDPIIASIVIPIYCEDAEMMHKITPYLESIFRTREGAEIILINNGGEYFSSQWIQFADVYIKNKVNRGYGPAINQGFKVARGTYLLAVNDDVMVTPGWLKPLLDVFQDPLVGVVRPTEAREQGEGIQEDYTWYHGFFWGIRRTLWQSLKDKDGNLLDEQFKIANFEDLDLWQRVLSRNLKLTKHYGVKVDHFGGLTVKSMNLDENTQFNEALFIKKHDLPNWREIFYP